jgi:hypothetical protein
VAGWPGANPGTIGVEEKGKAPGIGLQID